MHPINPIPPQLNQQIPKSVQIATAPSQPAINIPKHPVDTTANAGFDNHMKYVAKYGNTNQALPTTLSTVAKQVRENGWVVTNNYCDVVKGFEHGEAQVNTNGLSRNHNMGYGVTINPRSSDSKNIHEIVTVHPVKIGKPQTVETIETVKTWFGLSSKKVKTTSIATKPVDGTCKDFHKNSNSDERCVALTYSATGGNGYATNLPGNLGNSALKQANVSFPDDVTASTRTPGRHIPSMGYDTGAAQKTMLQLRNLADANPKVGRPGNRITVTLMLPESQAKALCQHLEQNPDLVRPFFLACGVDQFTYHVPPPYQKWDQAGSKPIFAKGDSRVDMLKSLKQSVGDDAVEDR